MAKERKAGVRRCQPQRTAKGAGRKAPQHVFGPVPSRRLGLSLGVDLVPFKVCTFDCTYCQLGRTTLRTVQRKEYSPAAEILDAIRRRLGEGVKPGHITLSGSGEPTLNSKIGEVIRGVKAMTDVPVAVLTNGSLLWMPDVRRDLAEADVVLPTLDAGDEPGFLAINRPHPNLKIETLIEGMVRFRKEYCGQIWLEIFLVKGVNTSAEEIGKILRQAERIAPDKIQLNTAVRPTADPGVRAVPPEELRHICRVFGEKAEAIADFPKPEAPAGAGAKADDVLAMLRRRPCTAADVAAGLSIPIEEAVEHLTELCEKNAVTREWREGKEFFRAELPEDR